MKKNQIQMSPSKKSGVWLSKTRSAMVTVIAPRNSRTSQDSRNTIMNIEDGARSRSRQMDTKIATDEQDPVE